MSLRDVPDLFKHLPQHKPWVITIGAISVAMVLAVCSFSSWSLLRDGDQPVGAPTEGPSVEYRDISSRELDPTPLTVADVFPNREIVADPDYPPHVMMGEPHVSEDCSVAADGEVRRLLVGNGCSQVLRASYSSYDNVYFATAGVLNLPDETVATSLATEIQGLIQTDQGRFRGYISEPTVNDELYSAAPRLGWEVRGHFLLYVVIVRQDGAAIAPEETGADVVTYDILKTYLRETIERWSLIPQSGPTESLDPSAPVDPAAETSA